MRTRTPPSALKGKYQAPTRTWGSRFGPWSLPFVRDPESSQRGHPAFGPDKFPLSGRARGLPTRSPRQVPLRRSLGNAEEPPAPSCQRPAGCLGRGALRRTGQPRDPRGAGARVVDRGRGLGRGARCSPVKAPTAFLMSSALSKSVIDILQLFERAEQVRKD